MVTRLWAGQSRVQILVWTRDFSLVLNVQISCVAHTASYSVDAGVPSLGGWGGLGASG